MTELFVEELIDIYVSNENESALDRFYLDYPACKKARCFYRHCYNGIITMFINLPFNRQARFEYTLEQDYCIPTSMSLENMNFNNLTIKVYKMGDDYKNVKHASFMNELKMLKEKYNIKDTINA